MNLDEKLEKMISASANPDGLLPPEKAKQFMTWVFDESVLRGNSRIYSMNSGSFEAPYLLLNDMFEEATEGTQSINEMDISTGLIPIVAKEIVGKTFVSDTFIEDNIEQAGFWNTLAEQIAKAYATKEDDIFFNSTIDGTGLYGLWDGFIAQAKKSGHTIDAAGDTIDLALLSDLIKALPRKWTTNRSRLRFYAGNSIAQDIVELLSRRYTPIGDDAIRSGQVGNIYGVPIIATTAISETMTYGTSPVKTDASIVILTLEKNTLIGDRRIYRVEKERRPRHRGTWLVPSARVGFNLETRDAVATLQNVTVAP